MAGVGAVRRNVPGGAETVTGRDLKPVVLSPDLDPWERQPGETMARYNQFCTYRDTGRTRSMRKTGEDLKLNVGYVRQVAAAMRWTDRAEAFDRHRDQQHEAMWLEERRKAAENDARVLGAFVGKIVERLPSLKAAELSPADLIRALDVVMRHRRVLFGDPQMTVAVTGPGGDPLAVQLAEYAGMGAEQRRLAIEDMVATVKRRVEAAAGSDDDD
jgi:hypothetical protein